MNRERFIETQEEKGGKNHFNSAITYNDKIAKIAELEAELKLFELAEKENDFIKDAIRSVDERHAWVCYAD